MPSVSLNTCINKNTMSTVEALVLFGSTLGTVSLVYYCWLSWLLREDRLRATSGALSDSLLPFDVVEQSEPSQPTLGG